MNFHLGELDLQQVVGQSLLAMMGAELVPVQKVEGTVERGVLRATVHILGDWCGSVSVECPLNLAEEVAIRMFEGSELPLTEEVVFDVWREIANVTGGNLKPMLGTRCVLSSPKASVHPCFFSHELPECIRVGRQVFSCNGHSVVVGVHQSLSDLSIE